ncbi:hypothetical protein GCM10007391_30060 [Alteromonas halophila]|uniref:Uncharacterized protein n=1 Tax=Alteromonas halophila TaxID=516698 RepID=A0A918N0J8_9ALTE|nr:hypothetical protein GCM10007391_30060 [Alteromonas halophila]
MYKSESKKDAILESAQRLSGTSFAGLCSGKEEQIHNKSELNCAPANLSYRRQYYKDVIPINE